MTSARSSVCGFARDYCAELENLLGRGPLAGTVHSVFATSVNLLMGGRLVTVLAGCRPLHPYSLRLRGHVLPPLRAGDAVRLTPEGLYRDQRFLCSLERAVPVRLSLETLDPDGLRKPTPRRLSLLRDFLLKNGNPDGFLPLLSLLHETGTAVPSNVYAAFASARLPALFEAVRSGGVKEAGEAAHAIAGCGIGLTPSADDFLAGFIVSVYLEAFRRRELPEAKPLLDRMAEEAASRTNIISGTFLREASLGLCSEDVLRFFGAFCSRVLSQGFILSAMNVLAFGETSGTDILTGIYFGQKNYPHFRRKRHW